MKKPKFIPVELIIDKAGGSTYVADKCGITLQAITGWKKRERVPIEKVWIVSEASGLEPHKIRPDLIPRTKKASTIRRS